MGLAYNHQCLSDYSDVSSCSDYGRDECASDAFGFEIENCGGLVEGENNMCFEEVGFLFDFEVNELIKEEKEKEKEEVGDFECWLENDMARYEKKLDDDHVSEAVNFCHFLFLPG